MFILDDFEGFSVYGFQFMPNEVRHFDDWCSLQIGNVTWTLENLLDIIRSPCALLNTGGYST